jgi:hypothetical protein
MHDGLVDPNLLFITDEAYFHRTHKFGVTKFFTQFTRVECGAL